MKESVFRLSVEEDTVDDNTGDSGLDVWLVVGLLLVDDVVAGFDAEVISLGEEVVSNSLVVSRTGTVVFRTVVVTGLVEVNCVVGSGVVICMVVTVVVMAGAMEVVFN